VLGVQHQEAHEVAHGGGVGGPDLAVGGVEAAGGRGHVEQPDPDGLVDVAVEVERDGGVGGTDVGHGRSSVVVAAPCGRVTIIRERHRACC
jgi:hypothetical protein